MSVNHLGWWWTSVLDSIAGFFYPLKKIYTFIFGCFFMCFSQETCLHHSGLTTCWKIRVWISWYHSLKAGVSFPSLLFGNWWVHSVFELHYIGWIYCWLHWTVTPPLSIYTSSSLSTWSVSHTGLIVHCYYQYPKWYYWSYMCKSFALFYHLYNVIWKWYSSQESSLDILLP